MTSPELFPLWERRGYHVVANHFYQPIPDTRDLPQHLWSSRSDCIGVDFNDRSQLALLATFRERYKPEYDEIPLHRSKGLYFLMNPFYSSVDGEILYCMIRHFKPRHLYEIGSGFSTYLAAQAISKNHDDDSAYQCHYAVIDPYAKDVIRSGLPGVSEVIDVAVQDVPLERFNVLQDNDILFIDSSHMLKIGSDVQYEYLELLPRVNKGVLVHIHDIFLPHEYPSEWVLQRYRFWNEQYVLQAFLAYNGQFEVVWASSYMNIEHADLIEDAFRSYQPGRTRPGSFWLKRAK